MITIPEEVLSWWNTRHKDGSRKYLTNHTLAQYIEYFKAGSEFNASKNVLEIGIGTSHATREIHKAGKNVYCVDVSSEVLSKVSDIAKVYTVTNMHTLPADTIDVAFHVTVAQHIDDTMLNHHIKNVLRSLYDTGVCLMQFARCSYPNQRHSELKAQTHGGWSRSPGEVKDMIVSSGGRSGSISSIQSGKNWTWYASRFYKEKA